MKKFVSLLLTLMMALGMTALAEESKDQLARIQEKGEIVIATEGTWAPWTYTDENGNLVGFDVGNCDGDCGEAGREGDVRDRGVGWHPRRH